MRIISGLYKGRTLKQPPLELTRPTTDKVRQAVFNILEHGLDVDFSKSTILDAFAGTGAMGFEALSRGAKKVTMVEKSAIAYSCIEFNKKALTVDSTKLTYIKSDVLKISFKDIFDLIFLDPPYGQDCLYESILDHLKKTNAVHNNTIIVTESPKTKTFKWEHSLIDERIFGTIKVSFWKVMI